MLLLNCSNEFIELHSVVRYNTSLTIVNHFSSLRHACVSIFDLNLEATTVTKRNLADTMDAALWGDAAAGWKLEKEYATHDEASLQDSLVDNAHALKPMLTTLPQIFGSLTNVAAQLVHRTMLFYTVPVVARMRWIWATWHPCVCVSTLTVIRHTCSDPSMFTCHLFNHIC